MVVTNPKDPEYNTTHILILFIDGEVCFTKGGTLFGKRWLHQSTPATTLEVKDLALFNQTHNGYACVFYDEDSEDELKQFWQDQIKD